VHHQRDRAIQLGNTHRAQPSRVPEPTVTVTASPAGETSGTPGPRPVPTGATLEAKGRAAKETVLDGRAVLIKSPVPPEPGLQHLLDSIIERMAGVVSSQGAKYVMLNAPRSALDAITAILPGAGAPTVMPLSGRDDAVAVHAVCQEAVFWETLERLKAAGASAILVLPIEKMM